VTAHATHHKPAETAPPAEKKPHAGTKPKLSKAHARMLLTRWDSELQRAQRDLDETERRIQTLRKLADGQQKRVEDLKSRIQEIDR